MAWRSAFAKSRVLYSLLGLLLVHPLFVHTDRRIEGLVFITLLALLVRAILERSCRQQGLDVSARRLFQGFANLQAMDLTWQDGSCQRLAADMTPFQKEAIVLGDYNGCSRLATAANLRRWDFTPALTPTGGRSSPRWPSRSSQTRQPIRTAVQPATVLGERSPDARHPHGCCW